MDVVKHEGGIGIGASIDTAKRVTVQGNIYGQGGKAQTTSTTAVVGSVEANNVNLKAENNITDVATNYNAQGDLNISAQKYDNQAAKTPNLLILNKVARLLVWRFLPMMVKHLMLMPKLA